MRFAVVLALLLGGAACGEDRRKCNGDADQTTCGSGDTCVWLGLGATQGYFCAQICSVEEPCDSGETCKADSASSCQTCHDILSICE